MAKLQTLLTPGENETSSKIRPDIHASSCLPCFLLVQASFRAHVHKTVKHPPEYLVECSRRMAYSSLTGAEGSPSPSSNPHRPPVRD